MSILVPRLFGFLVNEPAFICTFNNNGGGAKYLDASCVTIEHTRRLLAWPFRSSFHLQRAFSSTDLKDEIMTDSDIYSLTPVA